MPLTVPIVGSGSPAYVLHKYPTLQSAEIAASERQSAFSSIDVSGVNRYGSLFSYDISNLSKRVGLRSINVGTTSKTPLVSAAEVFAGESFMILADILPAELTASSLAAQAHVFINARLKINDVEWAIKRFNFQKPTGSLGSLLNVTLADPDIDAIPLGANVYFGLVINGIDFPLMELSQITDESLEVKYRGGKNDGPIDEVNFGSLDVMSDKFTLAPIRPVVMYDPLRVQFDDIKTDPENAIRDRDGSMILPIIEPVNGLTMKKILARAYTGIGGGALSNVMTTSQLAGKAWSRFYVGSVGQHASQNGCGFDRVITNIKDYRVRQANFDIQGGWHDGAQPSVAMYGPIYFPKQNDLVILDVDQRLPYGASVYDVALSYHKALTLRRTRAADKNQLLVTYQYMGNDPYEDPTKLSRDVFLEPVVLVNTADDDAGPQRGEEGYMKQTMQELVREFYMSDNPTEVLDTLPLRTTTTTEQTYVLRDDGGSVIFSGVRTSAIDTIDHTYYGNLKLGHSRTLETRLFTPVTLTSRNESTWITAQRERCSISWVDDPVKPNVKIQDRVVTALEEQCVVNIDTPQTIWVDGVDHDHYSLIPLTEANLGGYLDYDNGWRLVEGMTKSQTQTRTLRKRRANQYDVIVSDTDHLNGGGTKNSVTSPVTAFVGHNQFEVKSRTIRLQNEESVNEIGARIPDSLNCYELPRERAIELGERRLARLIDPLRNMPIDLPVPDLALDRGSVIRGQTRDGYSGKFIVTGLSINGEGLGKDKEHRIFENLECIELLDQ